MQGPEDSTRDERGACRTIGCGKKTVCRVRVQRHLLQQAEGHVPEEAVGNQKMLGPAMPSAEQDSDDTNYKNAWYEEPGRLFRRSP